ncbi:MAG: M81 family metallopeptidase [Clostridiales Family XIII bacterium]|nr:M81 family metallopeptidase [Clostridia bacterium]MDY3013580.1 M81 family metallopeptidase [Clostridiales Family XIII bacterium]
MKKIIIGQFYHESNSFSPVVTDETEFGIMFGSEIDLSGDDSQNTIGAFGKKAEEYGWEAIPVVDAGGIPSGEIRQGIYESVKEGLLKGIRDNCPIDAVLLSLHGASLAQGYDDPDGDLLEAVRNEVGAEIPIIATLDKHANVSELMVKSTDILLAFNREPHVDPYERGLEAGVLLKKMFDGEINPVSVRVRPPVLLPAINGCTEAEPMISIQNKLYELEKTPGVIDVSMLIGFYGSDKADSGPCTIVTTNGDRKLAAKLAVELSEMIWEKRDDFFIDLVKPEEAIKQAKAEGGVWAFVDEADDPFGGSTGDNVTILRKLIENGVKSAAVSPIADAAAVAKAVEAGVGAAISVSIGGKAAPVYGGPVDVEAVVRKIWTDPIHMSVWDEELVPMGTIVVLDADGIDILLTEEKIGVESVNIFKEIGMDINEYSILVIKGLGNTIRQTYGDTVKEYVEMDTASGQYTFLNTAVLEAANITENTEMPFGVTMQKAEDGEPTGLFLDATMFMDMGGLLAAFEKEPEMPTEESFIEEWAAYEQEALEKGITSIVNGLGFDSETRPIIERLRKECIYRSSVCNQICAGPANGCRNGKHAHMGSRPVPCDLLRYRAAAFGICTWCIR